MKIWTRTFWTEHHRTVAVGAACLAAGIIIASGFNWTACSRAQGDDAHQPGALPAAEMHSPFAAVAKKVAPAVVNVRSKKFVSVPGAQMYGPFDDFFRDFFGQIPQQQAPQKQKVEGQGSGFIIDKQGLVMTNNHVVTGGGELTVTLSDKREFKAEVVGADPKTDVAVIRLKDLKGDLPDSEVAVLGNSDDMDVGDYAIAIGNPFGLDRTVTQGIISYKGRSGLPIDGGGPQYQDFIQTDAAINYGNSGGPLVNIRGEVIGINTAINPAGQGIGFAIPINLARRIKDQLVDKGKVVRGYLGIVPQEITADLASGLGLKDQKGVLVSKVQEDTPADKAGLKLGDVIVSFDGQAVSSVSQFRQVVADTKVGAAVKIVLIRDKKQQTVSATLAEMPDETAAGGPAKSSEKPWLGIKQVLAVTSDEARQAGIKDKDGVVIAEIEPGSAADDAGLRQGDIIKQIAGKDVKTVADYSAAVTKYRGSDTPAVFLIKRRDGNTEYTMFVALRPEK
ncbi:MAG TPA: trypsin-like peptidase domain-containing protein [Candidatus Edwardsbacteria bacterium]|nr:trypsin-like peptidase domain-containing protein [Candidatus Edwardsbacteria bacterium]